MAKRDEPIIASTAQLAGMLRFSERRIQQLREAGMPRVAHGKWDLMAVIPWFLEHLDGSRSAHHDPSLEAARKRKLSVDTKLAEHKLAESQGKAITLAEHVAIISELCAGLAGEIEAFPVREYTAPDDRANAGRVCTHLRSCLSESVKGMGIGARKRREAVSSAPAEEREPVGGEEPDAATA